MTFFSPHNDAGGADWPPQEPDPLDGTRRIDYTQPSAGGPVPPDAQRQPPPGPPPNPAQRPYPPPAQPYPPARPTPPAQPGAPAPRPPYRQPAPGQHPPAPPAPTPRSRYIPLPGAHKPLTARERAARRAQQQRPRRLRFGPGCVPPLLLALALLGVLLLYLLAPIEHTLLLFGIDYVDPATGLATARSDTIMLARADPFRGKLTLLSIPRDLWVSIPGVGENRINTAHFYAESQQAGSGPAALQNTIAHNFGVEAPYYVRIRFEGFREVVDAMGGVDIELEQEMAGYPPGRHHLTGRKALAFVRNRANADDFFRMSQGQFMVRALFENMLNPLKWLRIPAIWRAFFGSIDTNLPKWLWPRLGFTLLRAGPGGIDSHIINRQMVTSVTTPEGAAVLAPNWDLIHILMRQLFP